MIANCQPAKSQIFVQVKCKVRPGLFKNEYIVALPVLSSGVPRAVEYVVDGRRVHPESAAGVQEQTQKGTANFELVDMTDTAFRILIPASGGSDSRVVEVPRETAEISS